MANFLMIQCVSSRCLAASIALSSIFWASGLFAAHTDDHNSGSGANNPDIPPIPMLGKEVSANQNNNGEAAKDANATQNSVAEAEAEARAGSIKSDIAVNGLVVNTGLAVNGVLDLMVDVGGLHAGVVSGSFAPKVVLGGKDGGYDVMSALQGSVVVNAGAVWGKSAKSCTKVSIAVMDKVQNC